MPSAPDLPAGVASRSYFESQTSQLAASATRAKPADSKLESYAHKFEAILIEKWLDDAESSFAKLPGDDKDPDADPGQDQFRSLGQQFLAESISAKGGLGIAAMIVEQLNRHQQVEKKEVNGQAAVSPAGTRTTGH